MKEKIKQYLPFVLVSAATATLTSLGSELARWGVDAMRAKLGPKPPTPAKEEEKKP